MSLDFSNVPELQSLSMVAEALDRIASPAGCDHLLIGAGARDLMLHHAHNIDVRRQTEDVDFAVMVRDWATFSSLRTGLIERGGFEERGTKAIHKLRHRATSLPLDIVPFGGVERADRTLAWPPEKTEVFDCFGLREALVASIEVLLPGNVRLRVAPIPALAVLKLTAWRDRKRSHPGHDAGDLFLYLRHYLHCGNLERLATGHLDILETADFDYEPAGARLLGRDVRAILAHEAIEHVLAIVGPETDIEGQQLLAGQSGIDIPLAMRILHAFDLGLSEAG